MRRATLIALSLTIAPLAGCGGDSSSGGGGDSTHVETTDSGTVIASRTDPKRGIKFEVQSSTKYSRSSSLYVSLAKDAPDSTKKAVLGKQVAFACRVPGTTLRYFPQLWARSKKQVGTALLSDAHPEPVMANKATHCGLRLPKPGPSPGTIEFSGPEFSHVQLH